MSKMKVGDLIVFVGCAQNGKTGIIVTVPDIERFGSETGVYQAWFNGECAFFTGSQLMLANKYAEQIRLLERAK